MSTNQQLSHRQWCAKKFNGLGKRAEAIECYAVVTVPLSPADLNFLVHHVAVRHPNRLSDEVARGSGSMGGDTPFRITGRRSEGRGRAHYERSSCRSKKEIFHAIVSFRLGMTCFEYVVSPFVTIPKKRF